MLEIPPKPHICLISRDCSRPNGCISSKIINFREFDTAAPELGAKQKPDCSGSSLFTLKQNVQQNFLFGWTVVGTPIAPMAPMFVLYFWEFLHNCPNATEWVKIIIMIYVIFVNGNVDILGMCVRFICPIKNELMLDVLFALYER